MRLSSDSFEMTDKELKKKSYLEPYFDAMRSFF